MKILNYDMEKQITLLIMQRDFEKWMDLFKTKIIKYNREMHTITLTIEKNFEFVLEIFRSVERGQK